MGCPYLCVFYPAGSNRAGPLAPDNYQTVSPALSAATRRLAAVVVAAAAAVIVGSPVVAAAAVADDQQQNDDPPPVVAAEPVADAAVIVTTHKNTSEISISFELCRSFHGIPQKEKCAGSAR